MKQVEQQIGGAKANYSRFVRRVRRRYENELPVLEFGVPTVATMQLALERLQKAGYELGSAMRVVRQLVVERLVMLDVEEHTALENVMSVMSDLAESVLALALSQVQKELDDVYGMPCCEDGSRCAFWIMGMGKLGGRELNVSSDIDLIYLYEEGGHTKGGNLSGDEKSCTNHEYFNLLAKRLQTLIAEVTEHGFVFRIDLALRPNGNSGALAISLPMLINYFQVAGRDWERFAWMKARVVAATGDEQQRVHERARLKAAIGSFVYRGYLDFTVLASLRETHLKIREQEKSKEAKEAQFAVDVKLSRGGIRELEFAVQLFQVVRGGQFPEIRTPSTLQGLQRLCDVGLISVKNQKQLAADYVFLRHIEHRIQYLDDLQTHVLPTDADDVHWIAISLPLCSAEGVAENLKCKHESESVWFLYTALQQSRDRIAAQFDQLLFSNLDINKMRESKKHNHDEPLSTVLGTEEFELLLPQAVRERVQAWTQGMRIKGLKERIKSNLGALILRAVEWQKNEELTELGVLRFIDWLDAVLRRESYHALLLERPLIHQRLIRLLGSANWAATYLRRYPGVVGELSNESILRERFELEAYEQELHERRKALKEFIEEDEEGLMNVLRRAHHAEFFRTLVRDIEGVLTVEEVADDLSALADVTLKVTLNWCWDYLAQRHRESPQIGIVAYGKLGGIELGYGSDLDIVFIYDDADEHSAEVYSAHVRKLLVWLTSKTSEGDLFEIDTSLRPNGNSGLLVSSIDAFEAYQLGRGSNIAWTWEHQALTRARCAVGTEEMVRRFDRVRHQVLIEKREVLALKKEVLAMRERIKAAHPLPEGLGDVKYSAGAMLDIEFCVQFIVLAYSRQYSELEEDVGNIALLLRAGQAGVISTVLGEQAASSYRLLRQMQHQLRLNEGNVIGGVEFEEACKVGISLWEDLFF